MNNWRPGVYDALRAIVEEDDRSRREHLFDAFEKLVQLPDVFVVREDLADAVRAALKTLCEEEKWVPSPPQGFIPSLPLPDWFDPRTMMQEKTDE